MALFTRYLALIMLITVVKSHKNTQWNTCGRRIILNGKVFFVRGVNYSPVPAGETSGRVDYLTVKPVWSRDLPILRKMHVNAIKVTKRVLV